MADFATYMPEVQIVPDPERYFAEARQMVTTPRQNDHPHQRYVVLLTPGRLLMQIACQRPGSATPAMIEEIERIVPSVPPKNITVIAFTQVVPSREDRRAMSRSKSLLDNLAEAIPFFGYILGLGYIGHTVTIFEGHPSALVAGCRDADVLVVDQGMLPHLQQDWVEVAFGVMRQPSPYIVLFGRDQTVSKIVKGETNSIKWPKRL